MKSKQVLIIILLAMCFTRLLILPSKILTWDTFGYYLYLPATFIYDDLKLKNETWINDLFDKYQPSDTKYQINHISKNKVIKYTSGNAIIYSPFFFLAHAYAKISAYNPDGLSPPYQYIITAGGMLYLFIGLLFIRKILLTYFNERVSSLTLILIVFGTNFLQFTCLDGTLLTHSFLFTLYAMLIWFTIRWHTTYLLKHAVIIGFCIGFIGLVRPSEMVAVFIPLFWNIRHSIPHLFKNFHHVITAVLISTLIGSIQFLYWKYTTGEFIINSYQVANEELDFLKPHIIEILFSFRKGWFIYTPLMLFAFSGFYILYCKNKTIFWPLFIFILCEIYVISCWSTWWYAGGSFSPRPFVASYAVLTIPLAFFIDYILSKRSLIKVIFFVIAFFFIALNLFQSWQFEQSIIDRERMTKDYYFAVFGKTKIIPEYNKLLLIDRSLTNIAESPYYEKYNSELMNTKSKGVVRLNKTNKFLNLLSKPYVKLTNKDHTWINTKVNVYVHEQFDPQDLELVCTVQHNGKNYKYRVAKLAKESLNKNQWNPLSMQFLTPELRSNQDEVKVYFWYRGNNEVELKDLQIEKFSPPD